MKFNIITLGCKVNLYESEIMKEKLIQNGFLATDFDQADIVVINTCSVTNMADKKSLRQVKHAKRAGKILVVCGCSSENHQVDYQSQGIDILIGNKDKSKIASILLQYLKTKQAITCFYNQEEYEFEDMTIDKFLDHTRAFVKIQDGCNNFCSYCIIPYVRKNIRNKEFQKAINEIKTLVKNGHKEIVLTGIHTGSYHTPEGHDLTDLIHEISKIEALKRIRISSIEATEINDKLLQEIKENPKIVNHFHIPLQSGSDAILKRMNRKYTVEFYKEKIAAIRNIKPDVSITTDVIVGHPYETDDLFLETIKTCQEINFAKIHVFPYSKRDGTLSSTMPMQVEEKIKKQRSKTLGEISKNLEESFFKKHLDQQVEVLIEEVFENESIGHTTNYLKIKVSEKLEKNELYLVHLTDVQDGYLLGKRKEKVSL